MEGVALTLPAAQASQRVSVVAVHAFAWNEPASQVVHGTQLPARRNVFSGQLPQSSGPGPRHVVQVPWQAEHEESVVAVHAVDS